MEAWARLLRFVVFSRKENLFVLSADGKVWVKSKEEAGLWLSLQRTSCLAWMKSRVPHAYTLAISALHRWRQENQRSIVSLG